MDKKRLIVVLIIAAMLLLASVGTALAYMFKDTGDVPNEFIPGVVSCEISEEIKNDVKSKITVKNTGNIDAYIRVKLVTYWVNGSGDVVPKAPAEINFTPGSGWVKSSISNTYYYSVPVAPGAKIESLLGSSITLKEEDGYLQKVDVFAEAIQANPTTAVSSSWHVTVSGSTITSAK